MYPFPIHDWVTFTWWISHSTYLESLSNNNKAVFLLPLSKFQLVKLLPLYTPPAWKRCPFRAGLPTVIQTQFPTVYLKHRLAFFKTIFVVFMNSFLAGQRESVLCVEGNSPKRRLQLLRVRPTCRVLLSSKKERCSEKRQQDCSGTNIQRFSRANDLVTRFGVEQPPWVRTMWETKDLLWYCNSKPYHKYLSSVKYMIILKLKET